MNELLLLGIGATIIVTLIIILFILLARLSTLEKTSAVELLKSDVTELTRQMSAMQGSIGDRLDKSASSMQTSVANQLQQSSKLVADVTQRLAKLDETNRRVVDVADELKLLQNVLQNPKQRGGLGEYYLETVLANVLPPHVYETQYAFSNGDIVDAVIHVDNQRIIPIDSKFSMENYNRLIEAKDKTQRALHARQFKSDTKKRIDETAKYIRPNENTLDYAFMFIPSEAIYYDLLVSNIGESGTNSRDLIEYAFVDKRVIIVSPTTLLAYLQTVLQGLRSLQIEEQAKDIKKRLGDLSKHIKAHETYMQKLGGAFRVAVNHFNNAHKSLGHIDNDVTKITDGQNQVAPMHLNKPDIDNE